MDPRRRGGYPLPMHIRTVVFPLLVACAGARSTAPEPVEPEPPAAPAPAPVPEPELRVSPVSHATFRLEFPDGPTVWIDPVAQDGSVAPLEALGPADVVLVTDIHGDHLDPAGIAAVRTEQTTIIAPAAAAEQLAGSAPDLAVTRLANGESTEAAGITVTAVPMYNLTRGPAEGQLFHEKGRGNGYLLDIGDTRIYVSGDTACTEEMRALTEVDVAFVCMNLPYTMPPEEAAACVTAFAPDVVYPYHYRGTEGLSDLDAFAGPVEAAGIEVRRLDWYPAAE
jgi:L-ascorbate metabolism protein UlaG (beta-lactamase superfamily)